MYYNLPLLKFEIILFIVCVSYIIYFLFGKFFGIFISLKKIAGIGKKRNTQNVTKIQITEDKNLHANSYISNKNQISQEDKNKVGELLKKIKINISKAEYDLAKNLIVEGLTIDKFNIELNLELAGIYILEKEYHKAEYIYKDLLLVHQGDFEILKKLAYVLTMQEKYDIAIEIYKKANEIKQDDKEVINMLAHLYYFKRMYVDAITNLKIFLKDDPRNSENIILLAASYRNIGKILDSINTYKRALEIEPYNAEIKKEITELEALGYENQE